jgi:hypothetical protein
MSTNGISKSQAAQASACCKVGDDTAPPRPQIAHAIASAGVAPEGARFHPNRAPQPRPAGRDPIYFEVRDWEPGTTFEMINKSNDPTATFDTKGAVHRFEPTGRSVNDRTAAVFIPTDEVEKMNWDPGDMITMRAVDADGNASAPASARIQGEGYGRVGRIQEGRSFSPGSSMQLLDGEGARKDVLLKHIADNKPPVTKHFEKSLRLETAKDGKVTLKSPVALEQGAQVEVHNGRTGERHRADASEEGTVSLGLGQNVKNGDTLFVTVRDVNRVEAEPFEVRYSNQCKDGRAHNRGILAARLPGAIEIPKSDG